MGVIRNIVNKADNTEAVKEEVKENLSVLLSLAQAKANLFKEEIERDLVQGKTVDDLTVPITKVVARRIEYRAITKDGMSNTLDELAKSINDMISSGGEAESIVSGIASIANNALKTILGTAEGQEDNVKTYSVVADYPAIVRFDFAFWVRTVKAASIKDHMEQALACVAYKSAVDVSQLRFNDFLTLYGPVLRAAFGNDPVKMKEMVKQAKEIYTDFYGNQMTLQGGQVSAEPFEIDAINLRMFNSVQGRLAKYSGPLNVECDRDPLAIVMGEKD